MPRVIIMFFVRADPAELSGQTVLSGAIRGDPLAPADPEEPRRGLGDARPDAIRIGIRLTRVLVAPAFGYLQRRVAMFVDQNGGQFDDLLLVHLIKLIHGAAVRFRFRGALEERFFLSR